jgi:hypothetical protein
MAEFFAGAKAFVRSMLILTFLMCKCDIAWSDMTSHALQQHQQAVLLRLGQSGPTFCLHRSMSTFFSHENEPAVHGC